MSQENVERIRRAYEVFNRLGWESEEARRPGLRPAVWRSRVANLGVFDLVLAAQAAGFVVRSSHLANIAHLDLRVGGPAPPIQGQVSFAPDFQRRENEQAHQEQSKRTEHRECVWLDASASSHSGRQRNVMPGWIRSSVKRT